MLSPKNNRKYEDHPATNKTNENQQKLVVISSGLDVTMPNFLPNILKIVCSAFPGNILVISARSTSTEEKQYCKRMSVKHLMPEEKNKKNGIFNRISRDFLTQLTMSYEIIKEKKADIYLFFLAQSLILPIIILKILRRKIILIIGASFFELAKYQKDQLLLIPKIEEQISFKLVDYIVIYSKSLIGKWHLEKYQNKILIAHKHFIDIDKFEIINTFHERRNIIGYFGRFSEEKGVLNFLSAVQMVLEKETEVTFLLGGDGYLRNRIEKYLDENGLKNKVKLTGWIPNDELPYYLNELKLLVLPSYTEGLPNIMLEAMACGTPVLATSVGSIPDIIADEDTGFIMENNSPACIAENVIRTLKHPNLEAIIKNARALVEGEFTYETTMEKYKTIFDKLKGVKLCQVV